MITTQHIEEDLSKAYIQAVAAKAGVNLGIRDRSHDYTVDGTFHQVQSINGDRAESGHGIDFQLKASKNVIVGSEDVRYDLDADTYNYLVRRSNRARTRSIILILLALHEVQDNWLALSEEELAIRKCCYWTRLSGAVTGNASTRRVQIPRSQQFTPATLVKLLEQVELGADLR